MNQRCYVTIYFEVSSSSSFRDIPKKQFVTAEAADIGDSTGWNASAFHLNLPDMMFADDKSLDQNRKENDQISLQDNLSQLDRWSIQLAVNIQCRRCKVMHVSHTCNTRYFTREGAGMKELEPLQRIKTSAYSLHRPCGRPDSASRLQPRLKEL